MNKFLFYFVGISYGQGVYFAVNSAYSNNFAKNPNSTIRKMIKSRVLVGESCLGNSSMREPPKKPNGEEIRSWKNNLVSAILKR